MIAMPFDLAKATEDVRAREAKVNELRSQLATAERELAEAKEHAGEGLRDLMREFGLAAAEQEEHVPVLTIKKQPVGSRKPRAERWKIQRFLKYIRDHSPTTEQMEAKLPELDISIATIYKYTVKDETGHVRLTPEGLAAIEP